MIQTINRLVSQILGEQSLDWRNCYFSVSSQPPDGRIVTCECSHGDVLEQLERRLAWAGVGCKSIRFCRLPAETDDMPAGLIAASSVADVRKSPSHASELLTQIVYGDAVTPLKMEGEWYLVRLDDGYVGWIRGWHVEAIAPDAQQEYRRLAAHRILANHAAVLQGPSDEALPVSDLVVGTIVVAAGCGRRGWRAVRLPDGKEGYVKSRSLEKIPRFKRMSRDKLSSTGLRFLGIPYIWGGTTPKGFDCSGLMQRIFRLNGLLIPRDADQQSAFGRQKPVGRPEELNTGDLIFFGKSTKTITHVALVLSDGLFLHSYGQVRVGSLDPRSNLYEANLVRDWRVTCDPITY